MQIKYDKKRFKQAERYLKSRKRINNAVFFKKLKPSYYFTAYDICEILNISPLTVKNIDKLGTFSGIAPATYLFSEGCLLAVKLNTDRPQKHKINYEIFEGLHRKEFFQKIKADGSDLSNHERIQAIADLCYKQNVKAFLTTEQIGDYPCFIVDNVCDALYDIFLSIRDSLNNLKRCVCVTGSIGKTTTKSMVECIYKNECFTYANRRNNNTINGAMSALQYAPHNTECYIQEIHEGTPGSCQAMSYLVKPNIAVITNIGFSHLSAFKSKDELVSEFADITRGMPDDGVVVINGDDENLKNINWNRRVVTVAFNNPHADYRAENIVSTKDSVTFEAVHGTKRTSVKLYSPGKHNVIDALLAFAAADTDGVPTKKIVEGLGNYRPEGVRQNILNVSGVTLMLDCYNAAPDSMKSAVDTLMELECKHGHKRIAIIGDMNELGDDSDNLHAETGEYIAKSGIDTLIVYGTKCDAYLNRIKDCNIEIYKTDNRNELVKYMRKHVHRGDVLLVKSSHSLYLANIVSKRFPFSLSLFKARIQSLE
ncbi:MAG: UDP-N-acetylmuramoyl-tripeptide--D-alanyl-D-alanine ligase [Clostridiales bacterium]|nr:UDP-N-acetylmuramoyl-tripeptide--D-alanyl-D-alanine ligase [Clostridiales bacterium]